MSRRTDCHLATQPEEYVRTVGQKALEAMLFEVSATPKPGLVDRNNSGAHYDMDFFTFMASAAALRTVFDDFTRIGLQKHAEPLDKLLWSLQKYGQHAETIMFAGTKGINTHKGMIFSLGLICGAIGWLHDKYPLCIDIIGATIAQMCTGLCDSAFRDLEQKEKLTKGERMFLAHGFTGARGEAESGFATIRSVSYPVLCDLQERGLGVNETLAHTLLHLIAATIDTNIVSRHDLATAEYAREQARRALAYGGMLTKRGLRAVCAMDASFIEHHVSPGGCADLLAATYLIRAIETDNSLWRRDKAERPGKRIAPMSSIGLHMEVKEECPAQSVLL